MFFAFGFAFHFSKMEKLAKYELDVLWSERLQPGQKQVNLITPALIVFCFALFYFYFSFAFAFAVAFRFSKMEKLAKYEI